MAAGGYFKKCVAVRERLAEQEPESVEYQRDLRVSYSELGRLLELSDAATAQGYYEKSLAVAERLAEEEPESLKCQRDLCVSCNRLGRLLELSDAATARKYYEKSLMIAECLVEEEPASLLYQTDLAVSYALLGALLRPVDDAAARGFLEKGLLIAERVVEKEPQNQGFQRIVEVVRLHHATGVENRFLLARPSRTPAAAPSAFGFPSPAASGAPAPHSEPMTRAKPRVNPFATTRTSAPRSNPIAVDPAATHRPTGFTRRAPATRQSPAQLCPSPATRLGPLQPPTPVTDTVMSAWREHIRQPLRLDADEFQVRVNDALERLAVDEAWCIAAAAVATGRAKPNVRTFYERRRRLPHAVPFPTTPLVWNDWVRAFRTDIDYPVLQLFSVVGSILSTPGVDFAARPAKPPGAGSRLRDPTSDCISRLHQLSDGLGVARPEVWTVATSPSPASARLLSARPEIISLDLPCATHSEFPTTRPHLDLALARTHVLVAASHTLDRASQMRMAVECLRPLAMPNLPNPTGPAARLLSVARKVLQVGDICDVVSPGFALLPHGRALDDLFDVWRIHCDLVVARAAALLSGDLAPVLETLPLHACSSEVRSSVAPFQDHLVEFFISEEHLQLRKRLGLALAR